MEDNHRIGGATLRVARECPQCHVVEPKLGQFFARFEAKITDDEVALLRRQ